MIGTSITTNDHMMRFKFDPTPPQPDSVKAPGDSYSFNNIQKVTFVQLRLAQIQSNVKSASPPVRMDIGSDKNVTAAEFIPLHMRQLYLGEKILANIAK